MYYLVVHHLEVPRLGVLVACGCSSMVEQKFSKLTTRVRSPSPAPVCIRRLSKFRVRPNARRGKSFAAPHMIDMLARNYFRNAAVGVAGFLEVPVGPNGSVAEHSLGKGEVAGPIPALGTKIY